MRFKPDELTHNQKKHILMFFILILSIGSLSMFLIEKNWKDYSLNKEINIDLKVSSLHENKGFLILNDSIAISGALSRLRLKLNNVESKEDILYYNPLGSINVPFRFIKKAKNDTILIIKDSDSLFYKLPSDDGNFFNWN